jgi:uncharacterized membrane protein YdjX (TVP38/TMEM64 family)
MLAELFALLQSYGYVGIFLINLISSASIVLPLPGSAFVFALGAVIDPLFVGIAAGAGAAIGETTGYLLGIGGGKLIRMKWNKQVEKIEKLFAKYGGFVILFLFAATPLPDDIAGVVAGVLKYPVKKYFIAVLMGKIALSVALAYGGYFGYHQILGYFG